MTGADSGEAGLVGLDSIRRFAEAVGLASSLSSDDLRTICRAKGRGLKSKREISFILFHDLPSIGR